MEIGRYVRNAGIWGSRKNLTAVLLGILLLAAACLGGCGNSQDMFVRITEDVYKRQEEVILKGAAMAFEGGWTRVKLYFMLGLPTET